MMWRRVASRQNVDITTISGIDPIFYQLAKEATKQKGELFFTNVHDKGFTHYAAVDFDDVGRYAYKKYFNSPQQIRQYYKEGLVLLKEINQKTTFWREKLSKNNSQENLDAAFKDFKTQFKTINFTYSIASFIAIETWQKDCEKVIRKLITENNLEKEQESIRASIYKPWKKTALMEIQEQLQNGVSPKELLQKYAFLRSWSVVWYKDLDEAWFSDLKLRGAQPKIYSLSKVKSLLHPTKDEEHFITMAPYITFFKDWRDDLRRKHCYEWSFFFTLLAEKWGVQHDDIGYLTLNEIKSSIKSGLDKKIITRRKNNAVVVTVDDTSVKVHDTQVPSHYTKIIKETAQNLELLELRGITAYPGRVTGPVTIVRSHHDLKKIKEGDILLANTTHPNYLPAMHKAAAFVTNEGGMLSHAAIVAREMKKPCVVGTKSATEIFKDGDIVEVNASNGIVRLAQK